MSKEKPTYCRSLNFKFTVDNRFAAFNGRSTTFEVMLPVRADDAKPNDARIQLSGESNPDVTMILLNEP